MTGGVLRGEGLRRTFRLGGGLIGPVRQVHAVDGVDVSVEPGRTLGLVGESGCGKTTLSRLLLRLERPTAGTLRHDGRDIWDGRREDVAAYRLAVQPVFQNPYSSLDPRMRVGSIIEEPLINSRGLTRADRADRVAAALTSVGLSPADARKYPAEFSGGQRQRVAIARALAARPRLMILDECVSSQDVSIRAQILNLLKDLRDTHGLGYLFIAHDLPSVRFMSDEIAVMYLGRIVEQGAAADVCTAPRHPYTRALIASCLPDDPDAPDRGAPPSGELPSPLSPPTGCAFHPRCPKASPVCSTERPVLAPSADGRRVACHHPD